MRATFLAILFSTALAVPLAHGQRCPPANSINAQTSASLTDASASKRDVDSVDDYIRTAMSRQHIPGMSLVVIRGGKIIKSKGYGLASLELMVPATPETVYELASSTKPFLATAIMLLVQDKKINLEDKISKYLEATPPSWKPITIRHLLTHTSGIKCYLGDLRHDFPYDTSLEAFTRSISKEPLNCAPGEKWSYSNSGYVLLGVIVHKASGRPYAAFLEDRVFKPLRMTATRHDSPDEIIPNHATGYLWTGAGGLRNGEFLKYLMMNHGDRGILSTVLDLAKFDAALSAGHLLAPSSQEAMYSPVKLNNGKAYDYGLGWFLETVNGHKHVFHPGGTPGAAAMISRYPDDKLTIIFLVNGGAPYVQGLDRGIAQRYIPGLTSYKTIKLDHALLDSYTGYYNAYGSQVVKVTREKNVLVLDDNGRLTNGFLALSETEFVAEDADRSFTLTRSANREVSGMTIRLGPDKMNLQRIGPLFHSLKVKSDPDPRLTRRVEEVLRAMAEGGKAVEQVANIAPGARKDFSQGPASELNGIKAITFVGAQEVNAQGVERHGGKVNRILYLKMHTEKAPRHVLVYLTADDLVTDQDVVSD